MTDRKKILEANTPKTVWQTVSCKVPIDTKAEFMKLAGSRGYTINQLIALIVNQAVEHGIDLSQVAEKADQADQVPGLQSDLAKVKKDLTAAKKQITTLSSQIAKAEKGTTDAKGTAAAKSKEITALKKQIATLEKLLAKDQKSADANKAALSDAKQKITTLQADAKKWQENAQAWQHYGNKAKAVLSEIRAADKLSSWKESTELNKELRTKVDALIK